MRPSQAFRKCCAYSDLFAGGYHSAQFQRYFRKKNRNVKRGIAKQHPHLEVLQPLCRERDFAVRAVKLVVKAERELVYFSVGQSGLDSQPKISQSAWQCSSRVGALWRRIARASIQQSVQR